MIALKIFKKILLFLCISLTMLSTNACASTTASNTSNASGSTSTYTKTDYHVTDYPDLQVYEVNPTIYIDGKKVDFKALYNRPIINIKGRTMQLLYIIFQA
jgi:ABC-type Fe3+-hydroxamate transport system substrate-binding protein